MNTLYKPLEELESFKIVVDKIKKGQGPLFVSGLTDSQKAHFLSAMSFYAKDQSQQKIIVTYDEVHAKAWLDFLNFYDKDNTFYYPSRDIIFYSADVHSNDITEEAMKALIRLVEGEPINLVCSIEALRVDLMPKDQLKASFIQVELGQSYDFKKLIEDISYLGYEKVPMVESRGQFAVRGGIIDIYQNSANYIYRMEFFGDELDSIRWVNAQTQRSLDIDFKDNKVIIYPLREMVISAKLVEGAIKNIKKDYQESKKNLEKSADSLAIENLTATYKKLLDRVENEGNFSGIEANIKYYYKDTVSLLDYFDDPLIIIDEPSNIEERIKSIENEYFESLMSRYEKGYLLNTQKQTGIDFKSILYSLQDKKTLFFSGLYMGVAALKYKDHISIEGRSNNAYHKNFDLLIKDLRYYIEKNYYIGLLALTGQSAKRISDMLFDYGLKESEGGFKRGKVNIIVANNIVGFEYTDIRFVILSESEVFNRKKKQRRQVYHKKGKALSSFNELKAGDYVVHESYGIGVFEGIESIELEGIAKDFIKISYKSSDKLYMPVTQLDRIQKYMGAGSKAPKLNSLNSQQWKKTKARSKKAIDEMVKELIELYGKRQKIKAYAYGKDTIWQEEFEDSFPYEETDDQLRAIVEIKKDMMSDKVMDRLLCGDVGYGKTEVALRAAFKAVQESKQVAYLVPTTILAQQHYNNFIQRFKDYPVKVDMLSRFSSKGEADKTINELERGLVDILVGTHKMLSKKVKFKDLGLLIIDEEQRFGVKQKEKLKVIKEDVDVLTLSATPIPRTLHMSLTGIRDMSLLEEAPSDRQPIQTYVMEHDDMLIKDAINRELNRGGQVYYVYNRVANISDVAYRIKQMLVNARVEYAHGQMSERQLEMIMLDFVNGHIDVLVSTTIIETGLDIANVNTIIIQNADQMGLSQLYQLRGRVGRSSRIAYAYLTYRRDKALKEVAQKRLKAIKEFTEFGAGFHIAMRDLEIRGAGNILGTGQSGHMDDIGYELYCKLVEQAVKEIQDPSYKGQGDLETSIDLKISAYIPATYIEDEYQRLDVYKRIATINSQEDYMDTIDELIDRFGEMPRETENLLKISHIKNMANELGISEIRQKDKEVEIYLSEYIAFNPTSLHENLDMELRLVVSDDIYLVYKVEKIQDDAIIEDIKLVLQALKSLKDSK